MDEQALLTIISGLVVFGFVLFLLTFRTQLDNAAAWMLRLFVLSAIYRNLSFILFPPANPIAAIHRNIPAYIAYGFMLILYFSTNYREKT